jgi:signal peptidase
VIVAMGNPYVLGGLTIGATALVVWAFWPRSTKDPRARREPTGVDR